jgi:transposase-like protein
MVVRMLVSGCICGVQWMRRARFSTCWSKADDTRSAVRLMRKLLKKQAFVPKLLVTDKRRSYASAFRRLRLTCRHEQRLRKNIRSENSHQAVRRTRAQAAAVQVSYPPSASSACMVRFTTPSTFNATSSPDPHCGFSEPKLLRVATGRRRRLIPLSQVHQHVGLAGEI